MNDKDPTQLDDAELFERKTIQEVRLWDWAARLVPLSALAVIAVCYWFNLHTVFGLIIEIASISLLIASFIWWYWALYKIALAAKYIRRTQESFKELGNEIKQLKTDIFPPKK